MLEITIGGLIDLPKEAQYIYSICRGEETGVGFEMPPEASLAIATIFARELSPIPPPRHTGELSQCSAPLCQLARFADYSDLKLDPGTWRLKASWVDPLGLALGIALAFHLEAKVGGNWAVEVYSDAWPRYTDVLMAAKGLSGLLRIYTSTYDQRIIVADRAVLAVSTITWEALGHKKEWAGAPFCRVSAVEPVEVDKDVLDLLKHIWDAGGAISLKYAKEYYPEALPEAVQAGLVAVDIMSQQARITDRGIAALRRYGS